MKAVLQIFQFYFQCLQDKKLMYINVINVINVVCVKLEKWQRRWNFQTWVIVSYFKFNHWSKFHVNIITGSGVMAIFPYKGLIRNLKILPSEFRPVSRDWSKLEIPNLAGIFLIKVREYYKMPGYSSYRFWVIKEKPTGGCKNAHPHQDQG